MSFCAIQGIDFLEIFLRCSRRGGDVPVKDGPRGFLIGAQEEVYTIGGDEFALLTIGAMSPAAARRKVEFICKTVAAPYHVAGSLLTIGTSCGFALYPEEGTDTDKITRLADQRMYKHKQKNHALQDHGLYG